MPANVAASTVSPNFSSVTATGLIDIAKKFVFRAAVQGGFAENIIAASIPLQRKFIWHPQYKTLQVGRYCSLQALCRSPSFVPVKGDLGIGY
jgi:hypothetical protein